MAVDQGKLEQFVGKAVGDLGAALTAALVVIGDKLGLYKAMAQSGRLTSAELAARTNTTERYVREWLNAQAAAGYVSYDTIRKQYFLNEEQAVALADENSPAFVLGGFQAMTAAAKADRNLSKPSERQRPRLARARSGVVSGHRAFLPARLQCQSRQLLDPGARWRCCEARGGRVADVGCGLGASTIIMAKAYPASRFVGFDYHSGSIDQAREKAKAAGVADRVTFDVAAAKDYPGKDYDFVTFFDCLHDMGDPVGAAKHVHGSLNANGTWMVVEPFANDQVEDNFNPIGRVFYSASTLICTPASLSQEVGLALGAQAGEGRLRDVIMQGGFTRFRRATQTPFNLVLEARP